LGDFHSELGEKYNGCVVDMCVNRYQGMGENDYMVMSPSRFFSLACFFYLPDFMQQKYVLYGR
jgi:hypothetical protein